MNTTQAVQDQKRGVYSCT